jgi:hypothetical protein
MFVICRDNKSSDDKTLEIGKTYFVKQTRCIDNQIYYLLDGIEDTLYCYWDFNILSELRDNKLKEIGI